MALFSPPMRSSAGSIILVLTTLLADAASAHNGEPAPFPPIARPPPSKAVDVRNIKAPRWSWLHWWEANRERYLTSPSQEGLQAPATQPLDALRDASAKDLMATAIANAHESLAIESAMALGKMHCEPALPVLMALASNSNKPQVRRAAIVAIGLLGSPAAEKELLKVHSDLTQERFAAITATGLLTAASDDALRNARSAIANDTQRQSVEKAGPSSVLLWTLRQYHRADNLTYFRAELRNSASPWVAAEALLGLGGTRDHAAQRLLEDALFGSAGADVRAYENLENLIKSKGTQMTPTPGGAGRVPGGTIIPKSGSGGITIKPGKVPIGNAPPERDRDTDVDERTGGDIRVPPEAIAMAWIRSSAAIALGQLDAPRAGEALLRFLDSDVTRSPELITPVSFAIMSLTAYPTDASRDRLLAILGASEEASRGRNATPKDSPLRGFAALALGLYAKSYNTDQGPADRPGFDKAIMALAERLEDDREEEEVRTACAVALGLTQRTAVLPVFLRLSAKLEQRNRRVDVPVFGFVMLGRAMAGDTHLVEAAGKFLEREDDTTPSGILARRAAVLALGLTRSSTAISVLTKAWHLNHYVNQEVILALRLVGDANAANPVMERLRQSKDDEERAYMAQALGELLAVDRPTTLTRLTTGCNYTVRNDDFRPLQALGNGFLYDYLIASFGDQW